MASRRDPGDALAKLTEGVRPFILSSVAHEQWSMPRTLLMRESLAQYLPDIEPCLRFDADWVSFENESAPTPLVFDMVSSAFTARWYVALPFT